MVTPRQALQDLTLGPGFTLAPKQSGYDCVPGTTSLNSGFSCSFQVLFQPPTPGAYGVTLVADSDAGGSSSSMLNGTAQ